MYRTLDAAKIIETLVRLEQRIRERFADAGLARVGAELTEIARQTHMRSSEIARPHLGLRGLVSALFAGLAALLFYVGYRSWGSLRASNDLYSLLQAIDSGFNILALMGASLFFLFSLEERMKRRRAIRALHELRSIIHVIDMHQLTKDPSTMSALSGATPSSPKRVLTTPELVRYLDYCSEMLSLAAKVAAIYAQSSKDPSVVEASSDLQQITANLSAKIWQKINIAQADLRTETRRQ